MVTAPGWLVLGALRVEFGFKNCAIFFFVNFVRVDVHFLAAVKLGFYTFERNVTARANVSDKIESAKRTAFDKVVNSDYVAGTYKQVNRVSGNRAVVNRCTNSKPTKIRAGKYRALANAAAIFFGRSKRKCKAVRTGAAVRANNHMVGTLASFDNCGGVNFCDYIVSGSSHFVASFS